MRAKNIHGFEEASRRKCLPTSHAGKGGVHVREQATSLNSLLALAEWHQQLFGHQPCKIIVLFN
jgi:hypothetical protein